MMRCTFLKGQLQQYLLITISQLNPVQKASSSQPLSKVDHSKDYLAVLEYIPSDKEPDERIYWALVSIPVLFFLVGVFFLCWNQCGLLKPYCSSCCALCTALCTKMGKEDLNPNYGTDLDEVTSVAEVACVIV